MSWFLKGNARRFFRVDMPVKFFATPKESSYSAEIFFNGVNYMNDSYQINNAQLKQAVYSEILRLQNHRKTITKITDEIISTISQAMMYFEKHAQGQKTSSDPGYWINKNILQNGFPLISLLEESSPKTYEILSRIEEKFLSRLASVFLSIENSTSNRVYADDLPQGFNIDGTMKKMAKNKKLSKIPIACYFMALYKYFDLNMSVIEAFNDDHLLANKPRFWKVRDINISACGMSVGDLRLYEKYQTLNVQIYYPDVDEIFSFEGKVLESKVDRKNKHNRTTIEFMFPTSKDQLGLLSFIQLRETQQSMEIINYARN